MYERSSPDFDNKKEIKDSENDSEDSNQEFEEDEGCFSAGEPNLNISKRIGTIDDKNEGENEDEYIAQIEGLENELYIEQYITNSLKKDPNFLEELDKLKEELGNKNKKLEELKLVNQRQEKTLTEFRNKLIKTKNKRNMNNKVIINKNNKTNFVKEVSKNEAIYNALKIKDTTLLNALNEMSLLKKENEELKKKIYKNEFYSNKMNTNFEGDSLKNKEKIKFLQNEVKILDKQILNYKKNIEEQNTINKEYNNLKSELKLLKINNQDLANKLKDYENKILSLELKEINSNDNYILNINNLFIKKENKILTNKRQFSIKNTTFSKTLPRALKQNILPIISIQPFIPNKKIIKNSKDSILSKDFSKKLKTFFSDNESEYFSLVNKITNIENKDEGKKEYKNYYSNNNKDDNLKMMKYKLDTLKDENILQNKKIEEMQNYLDSIKNCTKEKDDEINSLSNKIDSLKKMFKN